MASKQNFPKTIHVPFNFLHKLQAVWRFFATKPVLVVRSCMWGCSLEDILVYTIEAYFIFMFRDNCRIATIQLYMPLSLFSLPFSLICLSFLLLMMLLRVIWLSLCYLCQSYSVHVLFALSQLISPSPLKKRLLTERP